MADVTWQPVTVQLSALVPWDRNPKTISKAHAARLLDLWQRLGQFQTIAIGPGGEVYDGHQRLSVLKAAHGPRFEVTALQSDRALTEKEREELTVAAHVGTTGQFSWDELSGWDAGDLQTWGFDAELLQDWNTGAAALATMLEAEREPATSETTPESAKVTLAERFLVPPFSVLDARQGYWQARKSAWLALGIQSELGRGVDIVPNGSERPPEHGGARLRHARTNATPGGSPRPAATLGPNGKTQRGDGKGRVIRGKRAAVIGGAPLPLDRTSNGKGLARKFGQDLMRGEHVVGENRLTWVAGTRDRDALDDTSRKNLAAGRAKQGFPHGPTVTQNSDGTLRDSGASRDQWLTEADENAASGTSIFDPVLCELAYTWFCPPNGHVLDPFAGGSVRGIVAACLGRKYTGIDLRLEQVAANEAQADVIVPNNKPSWNVGDSQTDQPDGPFDFVFSCPPYYDLEIYSDDPADLSNMEYEDFLTAYRSIVAQAVDRLADNRFACFVVGDVRDKRGMYRNFPGETIAAFQDAGAVLYNEAILVTAVGSLPIRVGKQFSIGRKLGKTHQNVLVFVKGDPRKTTEACGPVEIADLNDYGGTYQADMTGREPVLVTDEHPRAS